MKSFLVILLTFISTLGWAFNAQKISTERLNNDKWEVLATDTTTTVSVSITDEQIQIVYPDNTKTYTVVYKQDPVTTGSGTITVYKCHDCIIKHVYLNNGQNIMYLDFTYKRITIM